MEKQDYKNTLHMPKTSFEMRGNLTKKEPGMQQKWQEEDLFGKMQERRIGAEPFVLHDGPPYANGDIHLGHALNKILKDVINKSKYMQGYQVRYIPGWEHTACPLRPLSPNSDMTARRSGSPNSDASAMTSL